MMLRAGMEYDEALTPESFQSEMQAAAETLRRGDHRLARDQFAAIIAQHPTSHEAMAMHAAASAEMGDVASAEAALRRALEFAPGTAEYLRRLSRVLLRQRRVVEAAETLESMVNASEPSAALLIELANMRLAGRQFVGAEEAFRTAIALEPTSSVAGSGLVLAITGQDRHDDAVAEARAFTERCPTSAEAHARLAMLLERLNRLTEAKPAAERAVSLDPSHGLGLFALGTIRFRLEEFEAARDSLEASLAVAQDPNDRQTVSRTLGQTLDALGRYDEAFARFTEAKPAQAILSPAAKQMTDEFLRFLDASRRDLDAWSIAAWGKSPDYIAFSTPPVFVVGFPRSGTTMFERMLASHGRFITTDEYPAMSKLREHIQRHSSGVENVPKHLGQLGEPEIRLLRAMYFKEVERVLTGQDPIGKRLVDRHPINIAHLSIVRRIFPDAPVIVCIRDPRDAVLSAFVRLARNPTAGAYLVNLQKSAEYYASLMGLWLHFKEVLGLRWLEVKYENLVLSPEPESRRVMEFLGEEWSPEVLRFAEKAEGAAIRSPSYQQVSQGLYTHAIGRWRHYRKHFGGALETLRPFVEAFGYEAE